jgi:hypothetical protein
MNISLSIRNKKIKNRAGGGDLTAVTRLIKTLERETTQTDSVGGNFRLACNVSIFIFIF